MSNFSIAVENETKLIWNQFSKVYSNCFGLIQELQYSTLMPVLIVFLIGYLPRETSNLHSKCTSYAYINVYCQHQDKKYKHFLFFESVPEFFWKTGNNNNFQKFGRFIFFALNVYSMVIPTILNNELLVFQTFDQVFDTLKLVHKNRQKIDKYYRTFLNIVFSSCYYPHAFD